MAAEDFPLPSDAIPPLFTQNVAAVIAVFGLAAPLSMGWMLAHASAGLPPLPVPGVPGRPPATAASAGSPALMLVATALEFVVDNPGTWVFHCHILPHVANHGVEPGGMITVLRVSKRSWQRRPAGGHAARHP